MKRVISVLLITVLLSTWPVSAYAEAAGVTTEAAAEQETEMTGAAEEAEEETAGDTGETGVAEEGEAGDESAEEADESALSESEETSAQETTAAELVSDEEVERVSLKMENGDQGMDITILQENLASQGYLTGEVDGVYGSQTKRAIVAYCKAHLIDPEGLTALGILKEMVTHDSSLSGEALRQNKSAVYIVQKLLQAWGFLDDTADGRMGSNTIEALQEFMAFAEKDMTAFMEAKRAADPEPETEEEEPSVLTAAGASTTLFKPQTASVSDEDAIRTDGTLTRNWYDFIVSGYVPIGETLESGSSGDAVARLQKQLKRMGYIATGVDGAFGVSTARALKYFQRRNDLPETGVFDEATQRVMLSVNAVRSDQYVSAYKAVVNCSSCRVTIWKWTGGGYDEQAKVFKCSTGAKKTPTIKGTFQATGKAGEWYEMKTSNCWVRYAFVIDGAYFFHSVLYSYKGAKKPTSTSVRNLGRNVSHGCVRLSVEDAKWIYENCENGMTVVIK